MDEQELTQMLDVGRRLVLSKHWEWVTGMPMMYARLPIAWCSDKPPFEPGQSAGYLDHTRVVTQICRTESGNVIQRPGDLSIKTNVTCVCFRLWKGPDDIYFVPDLTNKYTRAMIVCMAQKHCRQALLVDGFSWSLPSLILDLLGDVRCVDCDYTGGENGGTCPECNGMLLSGRLLALAAKTQAAWEAKDEARFRRVHADEEGSGGEAPG